MKVSEWVFCIEYQVVLNGKFLIMTSFSFHFHFALNIKWFWIFQYSNIQIFEWEVSYNDQLLLSPFPFPGFCSNNPAGSNKAAFELSRLLLNRSSLLLWQSFLRNHSDCSHFLGTFQLQWQRKTSDGGWAGQVWSRILNLKSLELASLTNTNTYTNTNALESLNL